MKYKMKYKMINMITMILIIIILSIILYYNYKYKLEKYENKKILLINYANKGFVNSRKKQKETALSIAGINEVKEYNFDDIDENFKKENFQHFSQSRGAGYWVWKPYLILKTLKKMNYGEILVYCDAGAFFTDSVLPAIEKMEKMQSSIMLFYGTGEVEKKWTKKDIFKQLNALENNDVLNTVMIEAGFIILKKSNNSVEFISKWLELCKNYHLISDEPSIEKNYDEFIENRHDQSLLSVLGKVYKEKYNIIFDNKDFVNHHKSRE